MLLLQEMLVLKPEVVGKVHGAVNLVLSICLSPPGECASQPTEVFVVKGKKRQDLLSEGTSRTGGSRSL